MMKQYIYLTLTLVLGLTLASCSKDQLSERSVLPPLSEQQSELDRSGAYYSPLPSRGYL